MTDQHLPHLRRAIALSAQVRQRGNHAFGALLVDPHGEIILEAENTVVTDSDCTGHAETNLVREATRRFARDLLQRCTLYSSAEPCAMCSGAIYWSGIPRVVFALSSDRLYATQGDEENRLHLSCREVLSRGARPVAVEGPLIEDEALSAFGP